MTLQMRFWGTRGSIPSPGARTVRYGGNTPCVEVRTETNGLVILDAGTGMRELGRSLMADRPREEQGKHEEQAKHEKHEKHDEHDVAGTLDADIFLTHAHWDHIQGIPFFAPIFQTGNRFTVWAPDSLGRGIDEVLRDQMSPTVFPVTFDELTARIDFRTIGDRQEEEGNGFVVRAFAVQHPGGALGYRFRGAAKEAPSFVYVSDNELGAFDGYATRDGWRQELVEFVRGASVLVHDATYTAEEYERHRGWGHSTGDDAVRLALEAGVDRLVLFHHKPERSDDEIDQCVARCAALVANRGGRLAVSAAAEGMTLTL